MRPRTDQHKLLQQLFATLDILGFTLMLYVTLFSLVLKTFYSSQMYQVNRLIKITYKQSCFDITLVIFTPL